MHTLDKGHESLEVVESPPEQVNHAVHEFRARKQAVAVHVDFVEQLPPQTIVATHVIQPILDLLVGDEASPQLPGNVQVRKGHRCSLVVLLLDAIDDGAQEFLCLVMHHLAFPFKNAPPLDVVELRSALRILQEVGDHNVE
eukprot:CAMPEP_0170207386 /NCGR_PEP_ID=MMETSP0116_2-20130129/3269_1 /TAXON_ID=400756 /ORGANISM="Durinskia baltica, Strain CSIRO CS-38" /LENGTH=140 /DNA_ID=CAMNT_0010457841 /DNA_START=115 /DNA_END=537 /DNA_ORIENTATION=-